MFNIIPLIIILISLAIIIVIVARKLSLLANLDVDSIPAEKEAKFKERIISNRLKRNFFKYYNKVAKALKPVGAGLSGFGKWLILKLTEFKDNYNRDAAAQTPRADSLQKLFLEAEELMKAEEYDAAEKKYIEIISLDSQNYQAFWDLGNLYFERKAHNEARQSLEHALKLLEQKEVIGGAGTPDKAGGTEADEDRGRAAAGIYYDLALICREAEDNAGAFTKISRALRLEPNNPRYLDIKLEISIINKDKISALDAFEKLAAVNPENQKLGEFEKQIAEL